MQLGEYGSFFIFFGSMVAVGVLMIIVSHLAQIRVKGEVNDWAKPYECGLRSEGLRLDRYPIHYYLVGILFVIFDVETVFFVPWAVIGRTFNTASQLVTQHFFGGRITIQYPDLAMYWFVEMVVFLLILVLGYVYLLQRGVFNWGHKYDE